MPSESFYNDNDKNFNFKCKPHGIQKVVWPPYLVYLSIYDLGLA